MMRAILILTLSLAAACGDDDGGKLAADAAVDAMNPDASVDSMTASTVVPVKCEGTIAQTVTVVGGTAYKLEPPGPISVNGVVKFQIIGNHNAVSGTPQSGADGKFNVGSDSEKCLQFTALGEYPFYCSFHDFKDTITVVIH